MAGALPFFGKEAAATAPGVAGYAYSPTADEAAGRPRRLTRRMTESFKRHVTPKSLRKAAKRASKDVSNCLAVMFRCDSSSQADNDKSSVDIPECLRPGKNQRRGRREPPRSLIFEPAGVRSPSPTSSLDLPRVSPIAQGIPKAERAQWILDHPERTTVFDDAVMALDNVDLEDTKGEVDAWVLLRATVTLPASASDTAVPVQEPTRNAVTVVTRQASFSDLPEAVHPDSRSIVHASVNTSQAFESILGHNASESGLPGLTSAIGLKSGTNINVSSYASSPMPKNSSDPSPKQQRTHTINRKPVPAVVANTAYFDTPDFEVIARQHDIERERKKVNRLSCRGELHFEQETRRRNFYLPSQASLTVTSTWTSPEEETHEMSEKEKQRLERISVGFLQPGPDLTEVAEEIFEQVLQSPPKMNSVTSRVAAIERGFEESQVSKLRSDADSSPFGSSNFPFLQVAAQTLDGAGATLLGPLPPGHNSRSGSLPTVDLAAVGDFSWRRFSDQDYIDPAVEDFRQNREKRINKRKKDIEKFERDAAGGDAFDMMETAGPSIVIEQSSTELISITPPESTVEDHNIEDGDRQPVNKRHSALLRAIDFTDSSSRSLLAKRDGVISGDLIEF